MKKCFCLVVPLLFFGCSVDAEMENEIENISFFTTESQYAIGSTVTLKLTNNRSEKVGYNLCSSQLEQKADGEWVPVRRNVACYAVLMLLKPNETATYQIRIGNSTNLEDGIYRFKTEILIDESSFTVFTEPFEVNEYVTY